MSKIHLTTINKFHAEFSFPWPFWKIMIDTWKERLRQDKKWGVQNHHDAFWLAILSEEVGEVSTEILKLSWEPENMKHVVKMRKELVEVAAVAMAWIECLDRTMIGDDNDRKD